jgi:hypothetical protein
MTHSEKVFLQKYVDKTGATSNVTTIDIAVSILAKEFLKSAKKGEELMELGEPEPYDITKKISMNEDNLMAALQSLEDSVRKSRRTANSFEMWDEEIYSSFREFRNMLYRIKDK